MQKKTESKKRNPFCRLLQQLVSMQNGSG